jgi:dTDP-4-amino-4,6-dideoxygalactose transaminase
VIPFLDLKAQYASVAPELEAAALEVLRSGAYVLGPAVGRFEAEFAAFCGAAHAVGVSSGTSALVLALRALGVGPGCDVVTVPATFVATVAAIEATGARPVFVDVDPATWTMDPAKLAAAVTPRTRAVVPVHLHGRLADMEPILEFARARNLLVIEDAAQAHGAARDGRRAGAFGDAGCFSFYPGKNLGACGEAGAVTTGDPAVAERVRRLRDWGQAGKYNHVERGANERLDSVQAAILSVKLRRLDAWTEARRAVARRYSAGLRGIPGVGLPARDEGAEHAWHVCAIRVADRDAFKAGLEARGVATGIHYPTPVHLQPAWRDLGHRVGDFPAAEALSRETLSLPLFPELCDSDVAAVIRAVTEVAADVARAAA